MASTSDLVVLELVSEGLEKFDPENLKGRAEEQNCEPDKVKPHCEFGHALRFICLSIAAHCKQFGQKDDQDQKNKHHQKEKAEVDPKPDVHAVARCHTLILDDKTDQRELYEDTRDNDSHFESKNTRKEVDSLHDGVEDNTAGD